MKITILGSLFHIKLSERIKYLKKVSKANSVGQISLGKEWIDAQELPVKLKSQRYFYNIQDKETLSRCQDLAYHATNVRYFVGLSNQNIFKFTSDSVKGAGIIISLTEELLTLEAKIHAYNLFHQGIASNKSVWLNDLYQEFIEFVIGKSNTLPNPAQYGLLKARRSQFRFLRLIFQTKMQISEKRVIKSLASDNLQWKASDRNIRRILITGWYGTETAGDKAILMEVISFYRSKYKEVEFGITSINEGLSFLTNEELHIDAEILKLSELRTEHIRSYDTVLFGGGPLMDSSQLKYIEPLFRWAHRTSRKAILFGCGYGPVKTDFGKSKVGSILKHCTAGFFRDELSLENAKNFGWNGGNHFACDPALHYVNRIKQNTGSKVEQESNTLYAMLRKQTAEYADISTESQDLISESLLGFFCKLNDNKKWNTELIPMHIFWYGNDDRDYFLSLKKMTSEVDCFDFDNKPISLNDIIAKLESSNFGLPMRFHAHVFLLALGIPFLSINYTGSGGKIDALLSRYKLDEYSVALSDIDSAADLYDLFLKIMSDVDIIKQKIHDGVSRDIHRLSQLYEVLDL